MARIFPMLSAALLILLAGCSAPRKAPSPKTLVSDMDGAGQRTFIQQTMSTLKIFRLSARDLRIRHKPRSQQELAAEVDRYVREQVAPVVAASQSGYDAQTRLRIGELQLVCCQVYLDLGQGWKAWQMLGAMEQRYRNDPELLSAGIDRRESGFSNLREGILSLKKRALRETWGISGSSSS